MPTKKEKVIYLTFDDGPHPELTPFVLNTLDDYKAKGTFFLIGKNVKKYPQEFRRIIDAKHTVGNHTYSHLNGWKTRRHNYLKDIDDCHKIFKSKLFRPPFGRITPSQIFRLKQDFKIIMWDVLSWDFSSTITPEKCLNMVVKETKNGSILVFHENDKSKNNLVYTLPKVLAYFSDKGYVFKAINY